MSFAGMLEFRAIVLALTPHSIQHSPHDDRQLLLEGKNYIT